MTPPPKQDAEASLRKLAGRLRSGFAKRHPMPERSRQTVMDAVRAQHERTQEAARRMPTTTPTKGPKPPEPEPER